MSDKKIGSFITLQHYFLDISKVFQTALIYADFFWKRRVLRWTSWKKNTQVYTENESKLSDLSAWDTVIVWHLQSNSKNINMMWNFE